MLGEGIMTTMVAGVILASSSGTTVTTTTYTKPNKPQDTLTVQSGQHVTFDGTVRDVTHDGMHLRTPYETVRVDFSRWDNFDVGKMFPNGTRVTISGILDNGIYRQPEIKALSIQGKNKGERFALRTHQMPNQEFAMTERDYVRMPNQDYAVSTIYDLEGIAPAAGPMTGSQVYEERSTSYSYKPTSSQYNPLEKVTGKVTSVKGREVHLNTTNGNIVIDTATMSFDPTSSSLPTHLQQGDLVTFDAARVKGKNFAARNVVSIQKPWQEMPTYNPYFHN